MMHQLVRRGFAVAGTSRHAIKAASAGAVASTSLIMPHHLPTPMSLACPVHTSPSIYAQSTTPNSSLANPAEEEAQKALDEGTSRLEAGDWEAAKEAYARSLTIHPSSTAHFNLGVVYFRLEDLPAAIKSFEASLALSKEQNRVKSVDSDAESSTEEAKEFTDLGDADAHTNLASCYILSQPPRPDLAVSHLQSAVQLSPTDGESWFNLGAVLEACERLEESAKAYEKAQEQGVERATENLRNVGGKILAARLGVGSGALPQEEDTEVKDTKETTAAKAK